MTTDTRLRELADRMVAMAPQTPRYPDGPTVRPVPGRKARPLLVFAAAVLAVILLGLIPLLFRAAEPNVEPVGPPVTPVDTSEWSQIPKWGASDSEPVGVFRSNLFSVPFSFELVHEVGAEWEAIGVESVDMLAIGRSGGLLGYGLYFLDLGVGGVEATTEHIRTTVQAYGERQVAELKQQIEAGLIEPAGPLGGSLPADWPDVTNNAYVSSSAPTSVGGVDGVTFLVIPADNTPIGGGTSQLVLEPHEYRFRVVDVAGTTVTMIVAGGDFDLEPFDSDAMDVADTIVWKALTEPTD